MTTRGNVVSLSAEVKRCSPPPSSPNSILIQEAVPNEKKKVTASYTEKRRLESYGRRESCVAGKHRRLRTDVLDVRAFSFFPPSTFTPINNSQVK